MLYLAVAALLCTAIPDDEAPIIENDSAEGDFGLPSFESAPESTTDAEENEPGAPSRRKNAKKKPPRKKVLPELRRVGFLSLGAGIGVQSGEQVAFDADLVGSGGVMFRSGVGVVGLANVQLTPSPSGVTQRYGLGAGVRFGRRTHVTMGLTANVLVSPQYGAEFAGTALMQIFGIIKSRFGIVLQPAFTWSAHLIVFSVTMGLGVNF